MGRRRQRGTHRPSIPEAQGSEGVQPKLEGVRHGLLGKVTLVPSSVLSLSCWWNRLG